MSRYSAEQASDVLSSHPNLDPKLKEYWEAIARGELVGYYSRVFLQKRDDYLDDLPSVDVRTLPVTESGRLIIYKCQGNYLTGLGTSLQSFVDDGIITDGGVLQAISDFLASDLNFSVGDPENGQRISRINTVLNLVIAHLQTK